jgi:integrase
MKIATYFDSLADFEYFGPRQFLEQRAENGDPQSTLDALADDLKKFLVYLSAVSEIQMNFQLDATGLFLLRVCKMYPVYLAEAKASPNSFVSKVAELTETRPLKRETVRRHISTINKYLEFNHREFIAQGSCDQGVVDVTLPGSEMMAALSPNSRDVTDSERIAILSKSMMAGVVSGGPKKIAIPALSMPKRFAAPAEPAVSFHEKAFPAARVISVIENAKTYRDRCLWALLAGTGIRTSEATQLRIEDIDVSGESVKVLPYAERIKVYDDITETEKTKLAYKGRTSVDTVFLSPFREIFFSSLSSYLREERAKTNPDHEFLFVSLGKSRNGRPLYLSDRTTKNEPFKKVQKSLGMRKRFSLHSLRHFFGTWLLNFAPHKHGYGYPLSTVRRAMGHAQQKTTERYAVVDRQMFLASLRITDQLMQRYGCNLEQIQEHVRKIPSVLIKYSGSNVL